MARASKASECAESFEKVSAQNVNRIFGGNYCSGQLGGRHTASWYPCLDGSEMPASALTKDVRDPETLKCAAL